MNIGSRNNCSHVSVISVSDLPPWSDQDETTDPRGGCPPLNATSRAPVSIQGHDQNCSWHWCAFILCSISGNILTFTSSLLQPGSMQNPQNLRMFLNWMLLLEYTRMFLNWMLLLEYTRMFLNWVLLLEYTRMFLNWVLLLEYTRMFLNWVLLLEYTRMFLNWVLLLEYTRIFLNFTSRSF